MTSSTHAQRLAQHAGDTAKRSSASKKPAVSHTNPSRSSASSVPPRKPAVPVSHTKPSPAKLLVQAFNKLCQLLCQEWASVTSLNLGVRSGTAVMDGIQLQRMRHLARRVHMLAVADTEAAATLVQLASRMQAREFQQLQVLLDVQGLEELSDFLSLLCRHSSTSAKGHSCCARAAAADGSIKQQQPRTPGEGEPWPGAGGTSTGRRQRAAAGLCDLAALSSSRPALFGDVGWHASDDGSDDVFGACSGAAAAGQAASKGLRFASLLPPGHILVKTAEGLQQQQQFEAALQAGAAARQPQQPAVPPLELPHNEAVDQMRLAAFQDCVGPGSARGGAAEQLQLRWQQWQPWRSQAGSQPDARVQESRAFRAPAMDLEHLWKAGRQATTEAVLAAAHLSVHESPVGAAALLLTPGLVVVAAASHNQQQPGDGGGSRPRSALALLPSRPLSPRSRPGSAGVVPPLQLPLDCSVAIDGGRDWSSRPGSPRLGSAAVSSRFAPQQHALASAADLRSPSGSTHCASRT